MVDRNESTTLRGWFVGFLNLDTGKTGHDCFSETSEAKARKAFRECYRHGNYKILCCVPYKDYDDDIC